MKNQQTQYTGGTFAYFPSRGKALNLHKSNLPNIGWNRLFQILSSWLLALLIIPLLTVSCSEPETAVKWDVYQFAFEAEGSYDKPYLDVELSGKFTSPEGKEKNIRGFWDGENRFLLRFTPDEEGIWKYEIGNDAGDGGLKASGSLNVMPAAEGNHGFVRRDAEHPCHFVYDDGTRYYMCGTTYYNILLNAMAGDKWKTAVDSALVFGINKFRGHMSPGKNSVTPYPQVFPFESAGDSIDFTGLNIEVWQKMDEIVQYSMNRGMVVDLMPFGFGPSSYSGDSLLDKHFLQYVIARYAAYPNLIWTLVNEWNYRQARLGKGKPYWNMMGETIREEDPWMENGDYLRPLSIHQQTRIDFQFFNYDWPVHAIIQLGVRSGQGVVSDEWDIPAETQPLYRNGDEWGNAGIVYNLGHNMPVVNDEFGYMGEPRDRAASDSPNREEWPTFTRERHRNVIWGIAVAGGYGSTGDKYTYNDGRPYFSANWHSDPAEYLDIKNMVDFFTAPGFEYWLMQSSNGIITSGDRVYAFAEPGVRYVFYAAAGGEFSASLEPGEYKVRLYDPRTGEYTDKGTRSSDAIQFAMPDSGDWVLLLEK